MLRPFEFGILIGLFTYPLTLCAAEPPLCRSARSGHWSAAATWEGGRVPRVGDKVLVREGHTVVYDVNSAAAIRSLHIGGTVTFAPDKDTQLVVGLIKIQAGESTAEEGFDCDAHMLAPDSNKPKPGCSSGHRNGPLLRAWRSSVWSTSLAWTRNRARRSSAVAAVWISTPAQSYLGQARGARGEGRGAGNTRRPGSRLARRRSRNPHRDHTPEQTQEDFSG